jgi:signal transduction histidine kinase
LRGLFSRRPPLAWIALAVSEAVYALAFVGYLRLPSAHESGWLPLFVVFVSSALLGFGVFASRTKKTFRFLMTLRVILLVLFSYRLRELPGMEIALAIPVLLEVSIYEPFFVNLVSCAGVVAVVAVSRVVLAGITSDSAAGEPTLLLREAEFVLFGLVFSLVASLAVFYREKILRLEGEVDRLDAAVGKLASANLGFQEYANMIEQSSMIEERNRITREIHDVIGYTLTSNMMMMEAATDMVRRDPDRVRVLMQTARENARSGLDEIRHALHILRAHEQPEQHSIGLIQRLVSIFEVATSVDVRVNYGNLPNRLSRDIEGALYHLIQEALTNSFRHGKATRVEIMFWIDTTRTLLVYIRDNGGGASDIHEGIGITGMRERLKKVSGRLRVTSLQDGFKVTAEVPLSGAAEDAMSAAK